jgi:hypothetical protein
MGRLLDEEATRRAAADGRQASSPLRRGRLFGRIDPNAELVLYAEAWARRIQLNTAVEPLHALAATRLRDPVVTVAMRSDGSVESVSFVLSSGVPEYDAAIRRTIEGLAPYPAFAPALAREYDVVEIRRTWRIDSAIRID